MTNGKGDKRRPENRQAIDENWDRIFRKKRGCVCGHAKREHNAQAVCEMESNINSSPCRCTRYRQQK